MAKCPKCEHTEFEVEEYPFDTGVVMIAVTCCQCSTVISFVDPYIVSTKVINLHRDLAKIAHHLKISLD